MKAIASLFGDQAGEKSLPSDAVIRKDSAAPSPIRKISVLPSLIAVNTTSRVDAFEPPTPQATNTDAKTIRPRSVTRRQAVSDLVWIANIISNLCVIGWVVNFVHAAPNFNVTKRS
jgi:hypothetical protein